MREFRILTNGVKYKAQEKIKYKFLWWSWDRWKDLWLYNDTIAYTCHFDFFGDAENALNSMKKRLAVTHEWTEVKDTE